MSIFKNIHTKLFGESMWDEDSDLEAHLLKKFSGDFLSQIGKVVKEFSRFVNRIARDSGLSSEYVWYFLVELSQEGSNMHPKQEKLLRLFLDLSLDQDLVPSYRRNDFPLSSEQQFYLEEITFQIGKEAALNFSKQIQNVYYKTVQKYIPQLKKLRGFQKYQGKQAISLFSLLFREKLNASPTIFRKSLLLYRVSKDILSL